MSQQHHFCHPPERVLRAIDEAAEMWGAEWQPRGQGGKLRLPVVHGLRRGVVEAALRAEPETGGETNLRFEIEDSHSTLNASAIVILVLGALGGLTLILWPVSPAILNLAPIGVVLALVAWLTVVSRLRNSGPEDFLDLVVDLAEHL